MQIVHDKTTKSRIITVRLSDKDFRTIQTVTHERGFRNVSELVRTAMFNLAASSASSPFDELARRIDEHTTQIASLDRLVDRLYRITGTEHP